MNVLPVQPVFRLVESADLPAVAAVHIESCLDIYRGMVPDDVLLGTVAPNLQKIWASERLTDGDFIVMAEVDGTAAALATLRASRYDTPYIDHFHVRPDLKGRGIGRGLWCAMRHEILRRGLSSLWLDVLEENRDARAFYRKMGGAEEGPVAGDLFGYPVRACAVRWSNLAVSPA